MVFIRSIFLQSTEFLKVIQERICNLGQMILKAAKKCERNCFAICPRHALHAKTIGFIPPSTNKEMLLESELPDNMKSPIE